MMKATYLAMICLLLSSCSGKDISTKSPMELVDLRGRLASDTRVLEFLHSHKFRKTYTLSIERFFPNEGTVVFDHYQSTEIPVQIVVENRFHPQIQKKEEPFVALIRIGYAYRNERLPPFNETPFERGVDLGSLLNKKVSEIDPFLPFGLNTSTHFNSLGSIPYVRPVVDVSEEGTGYVSHFDGLGSPVPITIHFYKWKISGVDIHGTPWIGSRDPISSEALEFLTGNSKK